MRDALTAILSLGAAVSLGACEKKTERTERTWRVGLLLVGVSEAAVASHRRVIVEHLGRHGFMEGRGASSSKCGVAVFPLPRMPMLFGRSSRGSPRSSSSRRVPSRRGRARRPAPIPIVFHRSRRSDRYRLDQGFRPSGRERHRCSRLATRDGHQAPGTAALSSAGCATRDGGSLSQVAGSSMRCLSCAVRHRD